jgi:hypothetical protein
MTDGAFDPQGRARHGDGTVTQTAGLGRYGSGRFPDESWRLMTQQEVTQIEQAALVLLHAIKDLGVSDRVTAALKHLPVTADLEGRSISLSTAREMLEEIPEWNETEEKG